MRVEHVLGEVVHVGEYLISLHLQLWGNSFASGEVAVTGNKVRTEKIENRWGAHWRITEKIFWSLEPVDIFHGYTSMTSPPI